METQLVRLDAPYNLICSNTGNIALHIATLIVIREKETNNMLGNTSIYPEVHSFPIVAGRGKLGGETWIFTDLKDCIVVCIEGEVVSLPYIKRVMDFCHSHNVIGIGQIPRTLYYALGNAGCTITLPSKEDGSIKSDYVVNLNFSVDSEAYCIVMNDAKSDFYFYDSYYIEPSFDEEGNEYYHEEYSIKSLAKMRNTYYQMLGRKGLKTITFTTKDEQYKGFVEQLNST